MEIIHGGTNDKPYIPMYNNSDFIIHVDIHYVYHCIKIDLTRFCCVCCIQCSNFIYRVTM